MTLEEFYKATEDMPNDSEIFIDFETKYSIESKKVNKVIINETYKLITLC